VIDIKKVEKIISDFTNKKIEILDFNRNVMWSNYYNSEYTFNKVTKELNKKFSLEINRRDSLK